MEPLAPTARLIVADPEPDAADVMESHAESLEANQEQPAEDDRFTDAVPPPVGRLKREVSKLYVQAVVKEESEDGAEPLAFCETTRQ